MTDDGIRINPEQRRKDDSKSPEKEETELFRKSRRGLHKRDEITSWLIAGGMWLLVFCVFTVVISSVIVIGWHLILPESYDFLCEDELVEIERFLLSGALVGLGTTYLRRYIEPREKNSR